MSIKAYLFRLALGATLTLTVCGPAGARDRAAAAPPAVADFARLSGARPQTCAAAPDAALAPLGEPAQRLCAWSGRVDMAYWPAVAAPAGTCLPPSAIAWHRLTRAAGATAPPWNTGWNGQSLAIAGAGTQAALAVWRAEGGQWSAVLWRWRPAEGRDTRAWEAGHWDDVAQAVRKLDGAAATPDSPLLQAWLDASAGKPRALDGDRWRWVSDKTCLAIQTSGIGQAHLQLPWSRDDARLEQRSGMQVQLARRFPTAEWLKPFTLLDPAAPGARTGAKFIAVWKDGGVVQGQLWIPLRDGAGLLRARIGTSAARDGVPAQAALVERELTQLAHAWEARHE